MTPPAETYTLLLVDDNPTNLLLLVKIIELDLPQVRVLTARSGPEGLDLAARERIDGAFIDVQMPQMSGLEMCRRLNANPRTAGLPLVLMTAHLAAPELRAEGLEVGAYDFIVQPISNVEMLARIKVMLRMCDNERQLLQGQDAEKQSEKRSLKARWIDGLLISGDGEDAVHERHQVERLVSSIPEPTLENAAQLFDVLADELPRPWRSTLLKLSLFDAIPLDLAQELAEITDIGAVFEYLHRHHLIQGETVDGESRFLLPEPVRILLRSRAEQELDEATRLRSFVLVADGFQQRGEFIAALECLLAAKHYPAVSQMLSQYGLALFDQVNPVQLQTVVCKIPDDVAAACGWISLFRGAYELHRLSVDAAVWLELAYQVFEQSDDSRGLLLTLLYQVYLTLCIDGRYERWDTRLALMENLRTELADDFSNSERVRVTTAWCLARLFFEGALDRVEEVMAEALVDAQRDQLIFSQLDLTLLQFMLELQRGRFLVARAAVEQGFKLAAATEAGLRHSALQLVACELLHAEGDLEGLRRQRIHVDSEQERSGHEGLFLPLVNYYEATLLVAHGDVRAALELLEIARLHPACAVDAGMRSRVLQLRGLCRALDGRHDMARQDLTKGLRLRDDVGGTFPLLENLLLAGMTSIQLQEYELARTYLEQGLELSLKLGEYRCRVGFHAWLAGVYQLLDNEAESKTHLADFVELVRQQRSNFFWGLSADLLQRLPTMLSGDDRQEMGHLFEHYLRAVPDLSDGEPLVPLLRVHCLGGFSLEIEGRRFDLATAPQAARQLFELLMLSPNKSMRSELLMGHLWPDSPAGKARNSFDAAHSRLRKELEGVFGKQVKKKYLVLEKGMLSLRNIWIDSIEVEGLISQARYALQRGHQWQAEVALWKVESLWQGEFLAGFDLDGEVWKRRVELNRLRIEQLEMLAGLLRASRRPDEAVLCLRQGLAIDPIRESSIRRLLDIYRQNQEINEAACLLEEYRDALAKADYESFEIDELIDALNVQWLVPVPREH